MAQLSLDDLFRLDDRVVVITGVQRAGRALRPGGPARAHVVVAARRRALRRSPPSFPGTVAVACDVAVDDDLQRLVDRTLEAHGRIDVLVNNAGIGTPVAAEDESPAAFRQVVDVNLNALFVLSQLVGRQMLEQGSGSIINIASILGLVASAPIKQASYTATKGAVVNLTRELAVQWAKGVRVARSRPGGSRQMTREMFEPGPSQDYLTRNAPMGRGGELHELDGALLYLAGRASSYVTGQILTVDGGWTAR
jgi:hypothetical protein